MEILLITNKGDVTTDFIVKRLKEGNLPFYRLNTEEIGHSVQVSFDINQNQYTLFDKQLNLQVDLTQIKSVYFRRPEIRRHTQDISLAEGNFIQSELQSCLEGLYKILNNAYWINNVFAIRNAENKIYQLLIAKDLGFNIPHSIITNHSDSALKFYKVNNSNCIIKPLKSGLVQYGNEEGVIFTNKIDLNSANVDRVEGCPVYLQKLITKKGDIRVTVIGDKIFSAFIHSQESKESKIDWRRVNHPLKHSAIQLPANLENKCLALTKQLSLKFAAIDFILGNDGNYTFLEINPNGQWAWIERQLNFEISHEITKILAKEAGL